MNELKVVTSQEFVDKLSSYPDSVREQMIYLRSLVNEAAAELPEITGLEETLKWGEPSYLTKIGSTIRMDWKKKAPDQYQLYFKCTSKLVETFREVYGNSFEYENNRAIVFKLNQKVPAANIKKCIKAALMYHKVKHQNRLGM